MKEYLLKLFYGDTQKLAAVVDATSQPAASATPEPDEGLIPDPDADDLQEADELSLANVTVAGAEYAEETQAETTQVQDEGSVPVANSCPGVEAAAAVSNSQGNKVQCEQQKTPVKHLHSCLNQLHPASFQYPHSATGLCHPRCTANTSSPERA